MVVLRDTQPVCDGLRLYMLYWTSRITPIISDMLAPPNFTCDYTVLD